MTESLKEKINLNLDWVRHSFSHWLGNPRRFLRHHHFSHDRSRSGLPGQGFDARCLEKPGNSLLHRTQPAFRTLSTILSLWVAVPLGYLTSRFDFPGKRFLEIVLDIPIVLPPLVIGISLLALFNFAPFSWTSQWVVFEIPAVILAQFMVACAFATRAMREYPSTRFRNATKRSL